nr:abortive infection family protein [Duganella qianjiadongensis]
MHISGPVSAVDRLHTALHGYFRGLCADAGLSVADDASLTALFKALRTAHPILKDLGSYDNDMVRVLNGFANAIDAINSLRNNGSIAHPSEDLLGEPEAHLAVNATRTIFNYIQAKVGH